MIAPCTPKAQASEQRLFTPSQYPTQYASKPYYGNNPEYRARPYNTYNKKASQCDLKPRFKATPVIFDEKPDNNFRTASTTDSSQYEYKMVQVEEPKRYNVPLMKKSVNSVKSSLCQSKFNQYEQKKPHWAEPKFNSKFNNNFRGQERPKAAPYKYN